MAGFQGPPLYRPFRPGERRPNADGSYSTEITTTWQLPDGQWANIPSLWMGPNGPTQFDENDETNILRAARDYEMSAGPTFRRFGSLDQAEAAARARSNAGGAGAGGQMADLARIKRNVAKMASQGAPEEDIDGYIASEGVSVDDVRNFRESPESQQSIDLRGQFSAMTQNPAKAQYDALPGWQKPIVAASDVGQLFTKGTLGMVGLNPENAAAGLRAPFTGRSYEEELAEQQRMTNAARKRSGAAGLAAEITGAAAVPVKAAGMGLSLAGRGGTAVMTGLPGLAARSTLMGIEGAGYGAANAYANDQDVTTGAGLGFVGGVGGNVAGEGLSAGLGKVAGWFNKKPPVPTSADWKAKADDAFTRMRQEGVIFTKNALDDLETKLNTFLVKRGYWPDNQPGIRGGLAMIKDYKDRGGLMTPEGLQALRQRFAGGYIMGNKNNNSMVREAISLIDDLLQNPKKGFVTAKGDPTRASQAYRDGMTASRNQHKLEDVEYLISKGQRQGDRNIIDNSNKRVKALLSDKLLDPRSPMSRGWNEAEKEAIRKASRFTGMERFAHAASGAAPQGKLTGAAHMVLGSANLATGNLPGLAAQAGGAALGWTAGKVADSLAKKPVTELARLIANGGVPPAQVQNLMQRLAHSKREALSRALMALSVNQGNARYNAPGQQPQPQ